MSGRPSSPESSSTNASSAARSANGREAIAIDADDLGRDALADLGFVVRLRQDVEATVAVEIDEARGHDLAGGIDRAGDMLGRWLRRAQEPQALALDDDRAGPAGCSRAVHDGAVDDDEIDAVSHRASGPARRAGGHGPRRPGPCRDGRGR